MMDEDITKEQFVKDFRNDIHYYIQQYFDKFGGILHVDVESQVVDVDGKKLLVSGARILEEL